MKFNVETGKNNPILRKESEPILKQEMKKYSLIGEEMIKFLKNPSNNGVGIAAPQIGINKRLICISLLKTYDDENFKTILMINPVIIEHSYDFDIENEGCLSIPKVFGDVARAKSIKVKYIDAKLKENILILNGIPARIVQHEVDHLNGILFVDKIVEDEQEINSKHIL